MKTIFISRYLHKDAPFKRELEKAGCRVVGESLVHIAGIRYASVPHCDWIFFSGKSAIRYFFSDCPTLPAGVKFAVMGRGSQLALRRKGLAADFVGAGNDAVRIGRAFSRLINRDRVLFVTALDSPLTLQRNLPISASWRNLYVYKNEMKKDFTLPHADILVFTSPYNVTSYFSKYALTGRQQVVAIGTTTMGELIRFGVTRVHLPGDFYERKVLACVLDLLKERPLNPGAGKPEAGEEGDRAA